MSPDASTPFPVHDPQQSKDLGKKPQGTKDMKLATAMKRVILGNIGVLFLVGLITAAVTLETTGFFVGVFLGQFVIAAFDIVVGVTLLIWRRFHLAGAFFTAMGIVLLIGFGSCFLYLATMSPW